MLGRIWRGLVRLGLVKRMGRGGVRVAMWISPVSLWVVDSYSGDEGRRWNRLGLVWSLHQDENMQSRWPKVNVGFRVFSFPLV